MMKALVYTQPHEMQCRDYPEPTLEPGEVIIEIKASGICGSDMHAYHGHDPRRQPGLVMGHELSGEIHASASPRFKAGQKVTVDPLITCGCCSYCRTGRDNLCENRGMVGMSRPGAYAEFMSIPASSVIPISDDMPHIMAVLTEPAATVLHALNISLPKMARPVQECKVLVIGGGAIGLLMALLLRSRGVHHVDLAETNPLRCASAGEHSKARAFDPVAEPPAESIYDYVVDAVGRKVTREMAVHALKPGGVLINFDADYSAALEDEQQGGKKHELPENHAHKLVPDDLMAENNAITMEIGAYHGPRPQWDVQLLIEAGFERVTVDKGVYKRIYAEIDEFINPTPIFTIAAFK